MSPLLLSEKQVEEIYGLKRRTLQKHRLTGAGMPFVKMGRRVYYRKQDLEAQMQDAALKHSTSEY